jgi:hypothetical protein
VISSSGQAQLFADHTLRWQGTITRNTAITLTVMLTTPVSVDPVWLSTVALISGEQLQPLIRYHFMALQPRHVFLPFVPQ